MMKIAKVTPNSRISEINATASNLLTAYAQSGITEDTTLQNFIDQLTEANSALTLAIDKDKAFSELEVYDDVRDKALQDLYHYLQGLTRVPNPATKAPAVALFAIFQKYGLSIVGLSYNEESSKIDSLLVDFATEDNQSHITQLSYVSDMVQVVKEAQTQFSTVYYNYVEQLRKAGDQSSASELKPQVLDVINNKLVVYLRAMLTFNTEVYGNFAKEVAIIIDRNNETVRARKKKV